MFTIGEIAKQTGQPVHRVEYIIRSRAISFARVGRYRIFDGDAVARIGAAVAAIAAAKPEALQPVGQ